MSIRGAYDAVSREYAEQFLGELDDKPLDRALLTMVVELAGDGTIGDLGCGPGHVTRFLAALHPEVVGLDLSPRMVEIAREKAPGLPFVTGSMLDIPAADESWSAIVAFYSVIHFTAEQRAAAFREMHRVLRPGGVVLVAFHVASTDVPPDGTLHLTEWFERSVDIDFYFLAPAVVRAELEAAGFGVSATTERVASGDVEHPSTRCYLLARRSS